MQTQVPVPAHGIRLQRNARERRTICMLLHSDDAGVVTFAQRIAK
jgi:hypothetical protein